MFISIYCFFVHLSLFKSSGYSIFLIIIMSIAIIIVIIIMIFSGNIIIKGDAVPGGVQSRYNISQNWTQNVRIPYTNTPRSKIFTITHNLNVWRMFKRTKDQLIEGNMAGWDLRRAENKGASPLKSYLIRVSMNVCRRAESHWQLARKLRSWLTS